MKPIKLKKKKNRCCPNCIRFRGHYCGLVGEQKKIPVVIDNNGCKKHFKLNKHLYF